MHQKWNRRCFRLSKCSIMIVARILLLDFCFHKIYAYFYVVNKTKGEVGFPPSRRVRVSWQIKVVSKKERFWLTTYTLDILWIRWYKLMIGLLRNGGSLALSSLRLRSCPVALSSIQQTQCKSMWGSVISIELLPKILSQFLLSGSSFVLFQWQWGLSVICEKSYSYVHWLGLKWCKWFSY